MQNCPTKASVTFNDVWKWTESYWERDFAGMGKLVRRDAHKFASPAVDADANGSRAIAFQVVDSVEAGRNARVSPGTVCVSRTVPEGSSITECAERQAERRPGRT